jgi:hypothetical protein
VSKVKPCPHESSVGSSNNMTFGKDGCVRCLMLERDALRDALAKVRPVVWREAIDAAARVARAEPEFPGKMPDELFDLLREAYSSGSRSQVMELERSTVRLTKRNIIAGIIALSEK